MKRLLTIALSASLALSCGTKDDGSSQGAQSTMVPAVHSAEQPSEPVNVVVNNQTNSSNEEIARSAKLNRILSKRVNTETFQEDLKIIAESGIYDSLVCASFKDRFIFNKNSLSVTYKQALDATKQGIESARRMERLK